MLTNIPIFQVYIILDPEIMTHATDSVFQREGIGGEGEVRKRLAKNLYA